MAYILGIDAAWTSKNPSGIALVCTGGAHPRVVSAAPSYEDFVLRLPPNEWGRKHSKRATLDDVLAASRSLGATNVDLLAVDMPLALNPVRGRRHCDRLISRSFGAYGCATHTPNATRPGEVSDQLVRNALAAGFELVTAASQYPAQALIEVYPHAALLKLCDAAYRLPYKLARRHRYWLSKSAADRLIEIRLSWDIILHFLGEQIAFDLDIDCSGRTLGFWKAWEDVIDAIVCCWVGLEWLDGRAHPYGDDEAAIWVPVGSRA